ncbi:MAG: terminase, partial [Candidatus Electrothrix sp. MAN1_4]|nr:terminase [Candidatus Electrothrix sp. MAN1_4]
MTETRAGRPTEYDPKLNKLVEGMFRGGATDNKVIEALGVARSTFYLWKQEHREFAEAVRRGKDYFDSNRVESAMLQAALGSEWKETS